MVAYRVFYMPILRRIGGGGWGKPWNPPPPTRPCGTEKSVVLRGLTEHYIRKSEYAECICR